MTLKLVKTRKEHDCSSRKPNGLLCEKIIKKGEMAYRLTRQERIGYGNLHWETYYFHKDCKVNI